jgi:hypothetical protein
MKEYLDMTYYKMRQKRKVVSGAVVRIWRKRREIMMKNNIDNNRLVIDHKKGEIL